jgi:hypothetical protein
MLKQVLELFSTFAVLGGGLLIVWGAIGLASGLREQNGREMQTGIWTIVGGGLIIAAAALFKNVAIPASALGVTSGVI